MKVKELISLLQRCDQELEVYGYADHGQTPEKCSSPGVIWVGELDHMIFDGYAHDRQEAKEYGYKHKAILL